MKKIVLASAVALASLTTPVMAQEKAAAGSGVNPYTQCGIGASIFATTGWAAAISNVIWDLGTTALSSALSSPEMCNAKTMQTAQYIIETLPELEQDLAAGKGDYLAGLAQTMGCAASEEALSANLRASYGTIAADAGYASASKQDRAASMYNAAMNAAGSCAL